MVDFGCTIFILSIAGFLLLAKEEIFEVAILHFLFGHELGFIIEAFAAR